MLLDTTLSITASSRFLFTPPELLTHTQSVQVATVHPSSSAASQAFTGDHDITPQGVIITVRVLITITRYTLSSRVCLCLSQVNVLGKWLNTLITQFEVIYKATRPLVFWCQTSCWMVSSPMGAPYAGVVGESQRLMANNLLYLGDGTRQPHSFN